MKNALTIDVEDWFTTMDFNFDAKSWDSFEDRLDYGMKSIMELLSKHNVKATFFILAYCAKKHVELVKEISRQGHEIGSHGSLHRMVFKQTPQEFREDIAYSKNLLEDITGNKVDMFRASSWSLSRNTLWAFEILEEEGFKCDSSIQPFKTPLSGFGKAPKVPFHPVIKGRKLNLLEFPSTVLTAGDICLPFSGGLYLRTLPLAFVKYALKKVNKERPAMLYVHPWEFDLGQPKLPVPMHIKFTHYYNIKSNLKKLEEMITSFDFGKLGDITLNQSYESFDLD